MMKLAQFLFASFMMQTICGERILETIAPWRTPFVPLPPQVRFSKLLPIYSNIELPLKKTGVSNPTLNSEIFETVVGLPFTSEFSIANSIIPGGSQQLLFKSYDFLGTFLEYPVSSFNILLPSNRNPEALIARETDATILPFNAIVSGEPFHPGYKIPITYLPKVQGTWMGTPSNVMAQQTGNGLVVSAAGGSGVTPSGNTGAALQSAPGSQVVQVPCTLNLPNPVPISVTPGVSQVTATLPTVSQPPPNSTPAPPPLTIPAAYVDNSPPSIGILRPPSSPQAVVEIETAGLSDTSTTPAEVIPTQKPSKTKTELKVDLNEKVPDQENERILREVPGVEKRADMYEFIDFPGLARNGLPIIYALLPTSSQLKKPAGTSTASSNKVRPPSFGKPSRGKNPFFNVNKRKHFEYYEYF